MTMIQGGGGHLVTVIQAILASTTSDVCLPPRLQTDLIRFRYCHVLTQLAKLTLGEGAAPYDCQTGRRTPYDCHTGWRWTPYDCGAGWRGVLCDCGTEWYIMEDSRSDEWQLTNQMMDKQHKATERPINATLVMSAGNMLAVIVVRGGSWCAGMM